MTDIRVWYGTVKSSFCNYRACAFRGEVKRRIQDVHGNDIKICGYHTQEAHVDDRIIPINDITRRCSSISRGARFCTIVAHLH